MIFNAILVMSFLDGLFLLAYLDVFTVGRSTLRLSFNSLKRAFNLLYQLC